MGQEELSLHGLITPRRFLRKLCHLKRLSPRRLQFSPTLRSIVLIWRSSESQFELLPDQISGASRVDSKIFRISLRLCTAKTSNVVLSFVTRVVIRKLSSTLFMYAVREMF